MYLTISLTESAARALRHLSASTPASSEILAVAQALGVTLEPMHPATSEPELIGDFIVTGFSPGEAESVRETLLGCSEVLGAYSKPPAEEPS